MSVFVVGRSYSSKEKLVENKFPPRLQAILPFRRVRRTNENFKEEWSNKKHAKEQKLFWDYLRKTRFLLTFGTKSKQSVTVVGRSRKNETHATSALTWPSIRKASGIPTRTQGIILYTLMHTQRESLSRRTFASRVTHAIKHPITNKRAL